MHLEGSVRPAMARRLAAKHGVHISAAHAGDESYIWEGFAGFISVAYDKISEVVATPEDYFEITRDYYVRAAGEGLIYGETFVSPTHAARKGIPYDVLIAAVERRAWRRMRRGARLRASSSPVCAIWSGKGGRKSRA